MDYLKELNTYKDDQKDNMEKSTFTSDNTTQHYTESE